MEHDDTRRELGIVQSTFLGREDRGIFTYGITIGFGGAVQSFGGHALSNDWPKGGDLIMRLLKFFKVKTFDEMVGTYVFALREVPNGPIVGLERTGPDGGEVFRLLDWENDWKAKR